MSLMVAVLDVMDEPTQMIEVPEFKCDDGRADLKGIRRYLRTLGINANRIRITPRDAQSAPENKAQLAA